MAIKSPSKRAITKARNAAGLSKAEAAASIRVAVRTWQQYERGDRVMHPAFWELFNLKAFLAGTSPAHMR